VRPPDAQLTGVGVSFGGPVHGDGRTVRRSFHVPGWAELPLAARLEQLFGVPAAIANDADAAALAEYRFGAGQGVRHLLYVTVSTGIGAGLVLDGRLHRGEHAWAGEIGHLPLKPDGPPCPCGRNGCLEAFASGRSIARAAQQRLRHADDERTLDRASGLWALPREHITAQDVATAAAVGDGLAASVWAEAMGWLGLGIAAAANLLNPGRVVIGGGLARAGPLLFDPVRQTAARYLLDPHSTIVSAALGDDVGIIGGAALVL